MLDAAAGRSPADAGGAATRSSFGAWFARELAWGRLLRLAAVTVEVTLIVAALRIFNVETNAFETVCMLALGAFLVHHFLPAAWRLPAFALLSVASVVIVLGAGAGTSLLVLGGILIALCHLPAPFALRAGLLLTFGVALAVARLSPAWMPSAVAAWLPGSIWPILGSMFMFRLLVYWYDLKHRTAPMGFWRAVAYFFMLPNVCFPLFPVVDYQTFLRNRYNDDAIRIYQVGARWMLRGLVQLIVYRFVYMRCMIGIADITDALDVGQYMLTTFLLYLKISGLFHMIVGLLHLFGFNLPETHHLYLLSSSFTDFWRRINIYWKDFITKLVFYPLYFRWRKLGDARAVVAATLGAFLATWVLHSYQWFWIRGRFPIVWSDFVFWFGLGIVVVLNVRWEQRRGRQRTLRKSARTLRSDVGLALRTAGTFTAICILWTIWSTPDPAEIGVLLGAARHATAAQVAVLLAVPLAIGACGVALGRRTREHTEGARASAVHATGAFWPQALRVGAAAAALLLVAVKPNVLLFAPRALDVVLTLKDRGLNAADTQALHRGYYEELGDVTRFDNELWRMYGVAPKNWGREIDAIEARDDRMLSSYRPHVAGVLNGALFTTNADGLRDREYTIEKPAGTFRIALIGASHDAGVGVQTGETYENVAEDLLNERWAAATPAAGGAPRRVEILNFSVAGYAPIQKLAVSEMRVAAYQPDVVVYAASVNELVWTFFRLEELVERGWVEEYPFLVTALRNGGFDTQSVVKQTALERHLAPQARDVLGQILGRFGAGVRALGARPVLVLLRLPSDHGRPPEFDVLQSLGSDAGFEVIDLFAATAQIQDRSTLAIAPWDDHTNPAGHRLLGAWFANRLLEQGIVPPPGAAPAAAKNVAGE